MTDLPALRLLAWQNPALDPCETCHQTPGHRCRTVGNKVTVPHKPRMDAAKWFARGQDARQGEVEELYAARVAANDAAVKAEIQRDLAKREAALLTTERDQARAQRDNLTAALAASEAARVTDREVAAQLVAELRARVAELEAEEPEPTPRRLPFGIGMDEKAATSAFPKLFTHTALEAEAGVKLAYLHEYFRFGTTGILTGLLAWCEAQFKAGRVPVPTIKLPGDDWKGAAAGKYDATIGANFDALEALAVKYGSRVIAGIQHEPDNDGKPFADFAAMTRHLLPIVQRPGLVEYWANYTGWGQLYGDSTDWTLDDVFIEGIDGYAFNPYLSLGASSTKLTSQRTGYYEPYSAWAADHGVQWGIWETGINENAAVMSLPGVKTWITDCTAAAEELDATMWFYWNNRVSAAKQDWRISKTLPADKHGQMVAAMKKYAPKEK